jgi:hypothetical protein
MKSVVSAQATKNYDVKLGGVFAKLDIASKRNTAKAVGVSQIALILAACGSSDDDSSAAPSTLLSLTKSGNDYSASSVTGFALNSQTSATFDVANSAANAYSIKLTADGTGVLHFDFADASDQVMLQAGSSVSGFTTLKVTDGSIDATNADLSSITRVEVASGIKVTLAQIKSIATIVSNSETGKIEVEVASEDEATELVSLMTAGTISVFGASNPIDLVAAPAAPSTLTAEVLTAKETESTASLKPKADAPVDTAVVDTAVVDTATPTTPTTPTTPVAPVAPTTTTAVVDDSGQPFTVSDEGSGVYTVSADYGQVTVTSANSRYVFNAADEGTTVSRLATDVNSLSVAGTLTGAALVLDGETITGTGGVAITALEGDAAADLSLITVSGTKTIAVGGDVSFTGDLGSGYATTVASGKTLTLTAVEATGQDIDGAGNVTLTSGASVDVDLTNIDATGTISFDSNTIAITAAKTLTLDAVQAALATSGISGAGNLTVTDDGGAANSTIVSSVTAAGVKTIDAGTGNDIIDLGVAANIDTNDSIDGGTGTDTLKITADGDSTGAVLDDLIAIDTITMVADSNDTAKVTITYTNANTDAMTINAAALTGGTANFTLVATDAEADGAYTITGSAGGDTIKVGAGADTIETGAGIDTIEIDDTSTIDTIVFNAVKGTSSDSVRVTVSGNDNDTGQDTIKDIEATDVILVKLTNLDDFEHGDDTAIGTATGSASNGQAAGSYVATAAMIDVDGGTGFDDADDIILNLTSPDLTISADAHFEGLLKYELTADTDGATMTGGAKADTITGGAGVDLITGGAGGDSIVLGGASTGADVIKMTAGGQTFAGLITSGSTALTGIDVITGAVAGDKIDLSGSSLGSSATYVAAGSITTSVLGGSASKGAVALVRGTYDTSTTKFTAGTGSGDNDYLMNYAIGATSTASNAEAIVLMDIAGTVSFTQSSEVYTIAVA